MGGYDSVAVTVWSGCMHKIG